ncbi:MAG: glycosyltransferase [Micrococcales bacterium]|nr:glycosyltransferase [Micrococcales bacterium]
MSKKRQTISAVFIVKDEEEVLDQCLESVRWADEIVVYDTGSTDRTCEIARKYTDIVIEGYWDDDFGAARNRAMDHATKQWVLVMDADEVFESQGSTLRKHLATGASDAYAVRIVNTGASSVDPTNEFTGTRVFRRESYRYEGRVHEQPVRKDGLSRPAPVLGGIRLRHSGYADQERLSTEKAERNVALARDEVTEADNAGDLAALAVARVDLARSLTLGADETWHDESREVAELAWASADLLPRAAVKGLVQCQVGVAVRRRDYDLARTWVGRWREQSPGNPDVHLTAAQLEAQAGDAKAALAELEQMPTVGSDGLGGLVRRDHAVDLELRLLVNVGRDADAAALVRRTVGAGETCPTPMVVLALLGEDAFSKLLPHLPDKWWRRWALLAVKHADTVAMRVLELMDQYRPDDVTVLVSGARVAPLHGLQRAADWDVKLHRHNLGHLSTLITYAGDERALPDDRAVAAALALSAYHDERALELLQDALDHVPQQREHAVAQAIEVVAPGLVSLD